MDLQAYCRRKLALQNFEQYRQHNRGGPKAAQDIDEQVSNDGFDLTSHAPYEAREDTEDERKEEILVEPRGERMLDGAQDSFKVEGPAAPFIFFTLDVCP
jgi:hypothetical protein